MNKNRVAFSPRFVWRVRFRVATTRRRLRDPAIGIVKTPVTLMRPVGLSEITRVYEIVVSGALNDFNFKEKKAFS